MTIARKRASGKSEGDITDFYDSDKFDIIKNWSVTREKLDRMDPEEIEDKFDISLYDEPNLLHRQKPPSFVRDLQHCHRPDGDMFHVVSCSTAVTRWTFSKNGRSLRAEQFEFPSIMTKVMFVPDIRVFVTLTSECAFCATAIVRGKLKQVLVGDYIYSVTLMRYVRETKTIILGGVNVLKAIACTGLESSFVIESTTTLKTTIKPTEMIYDIVVDPVYRRLIIVCEQGLVILDYRTMKQQRVMTDEEVEAGFSCCCLYQRTAYVITGYKNGLIKIWNAAISIKMHEFKGHNFPLTGVKCHPTEALLFSVCEDGVVCIWMMNYFRKLGQLRIGETILRMGVLKNFAGLPPGFWLQTTSEILFYEMSDFYLIFAHLDSAVYKIQRIRGLGEHPNRILVTTNDGAMRCLNVILGMTVGIMYPINILQIMDRYVYNPLNRRIYMNLPDGSVFVLSCKKSPLRSIELYRPVGYDDAVLCVASALLVVGKGSAEIDDIVVFGGLRNGQIILVASDSFTFPKPQQIHYGSVVCLETVTEADRSGEELINTSNYLVTAGSDTRLVVWRLRCHPDEQLGLELKLHKHMVIRCPALPRFVSAANDRVCVVFHDRNDLIMYDISEALTDQVMGPIAMTEGKMLTHTPDYDHTAKIVSMDKCPLLGIFLTASLDGTVKFWNSECQMIRELVFFEPISDACFATDHGDVLIAKDLIVMTSSPIQYLPWDVLQCMRAKNYPLEEKEYPLPIKESGRCWIDPRRAHTRPFPLFTQRDLILQASYRHNLQMLDWLILWETERGISISTIVTVVLRDKTKDEEKRAFRFVPRPPEQYIFQLASMTDKTAEHVRKNTLMTPHQTDDHHATHPDSKRMRLSLATITSRLSESTHIIRGQGLAASPTRRSRFSNTSISHDRRVPVLDAYEELKHVFKKGGALADKASQTRSAPQFTGTAGLELEEALVRLQETTAHMTRPNNIMLYLTANRDGAILFDIIARQRSKIPLAQFLRSEDKYKGAGVTIPENRVSLSVVRFMYGRQPDEEMPEVPEEEINSAGDRIALIVSDVHPDKSRELHYRQKQKARVKEQRASPWFRFTRKDPEPPKRVPSQKQEEEIDPRDVLLNKHDIPKGKHFDILRSSSLESRPQKPPRRSKHETSLLASLQIALSSSSEEEEEDVLDTSLSRLLRRKSSRKFSSRTSVRDSSAAKGVIFEESVSVDSDSTSLPTQSEELVAFLSEKREMEFLRWRYYAADDVPREKGLEERAERLRVLKETKDENIVWVDEAGMILYERRMKAVEIPNSIFKRRPRLLPQRPLTDEEEFHLKVLTMLDDLNAYSDDDTKPTMLDDLDAYSDDEKKIVAREGEEREDDTRDRFKSILEHDSAGPKRKGTIKAQHRPRGKTIAEEDKTEEAARMWSPQPKGAQPKEKQKPKKKQPKEKPKEPSPMPKPTYGMHALLLELGDEPWFPRRPPFSEQQAWDALMEILKNCADADILEKAVGYYLKKYLRNFNARVTDNMKQQALKHILRLLATAEISVRRECLGVLISLAPRLNKTILLLLHDLLKLHDPELYGSLLVVLKFYNIYEKIDMLDAMLFFGVILPDEYDEDRATRLAGLRKTLDTHVRQTSPTRHPLFDPTKEDLGLAPQPEPEDSKPKGEADDNIQKEFQALEDFWQPRLHKCKLGVYPPPWSFYQTPAPAETSQAKMRKVDSSGTQSAPVEPSRDTMRLVKRIPLFPQRDSARRIYLSPTCDDTTCHGHFDPRVAEGDEAVSSHEVYRMPPPSLTSVFTPHPHYEHQEGLPAVEGPVPHGGVSILPTKTKEKLDTARTAEHQRELMRMLRDVESLRSYIGPHRETADAPRALDMKRDMKRSPKGVRDASHSDRDYKDVYCFSDIERELEEDLPPSSTNTSSTFCSEETDQPESPDKTSVSRLQPPGEDGPPKREQTVTERVRSIVQQVQSDYAEVLALRRKFSLLCADIIPLEVSEEKKEKKDEKEDKKEMDQTLRVLPALADQFGLYRGKQHPRKADTYRGTIYDRMFLEAPPFREVRLAPPLSPKRRLTTVSTTCIQPHTPQPSDQRTQDSGLCPERLMVSFSGTLSTASDQDIPSSVAQIPLVPFVVDEVGETEEPELTSLDTERDVFVSRCVPTPVMSGRTPSPDLFISGVNPFVHPSTSTVNIDGCMDKGVKTTAVISAIAAPAKASPAGEDTPADKATSSTPTLEKSAAPSPALTGITGSFSQEQAPSQRSASEPLRPLSSTSKRISSLPSTPKPIFPVLSAPQPMSPQYRPDRPINYDSPLTTPESTSSVSMLADVGSSYGAMGMDRYTTLCDPLPTPEPMAGPDRPMATGHGVWASDSRSSLHFLPTTDEDDDKPLSDQGSTRRKKSGESTLTSKDRQPQEEEKSPPDKKEKRRKVPRRRSGGLALPSIMWVPGDAGQRVAIGTQLSPERQAFKSSKPHFVQPAGWRGGHVTKDLHTGSTRFGQLDVGWTTRVPAYPIEGLAARLSKTAGRETVVLTDSSTAATDPPQKRGRALPKLHPFAGRVVVGTKEEPCILPPRPRYPSPTKTPLTALEAMRGVPAPPGTKRIMQQLEEVIRKNRLLVLREFIDKAQMEGGPPPVKKRILRPLNKYLQKKLLDKRTFQVNSETVGSLTMNLVLRANYRTTPRDLNNL